MHEVETKILEVDVVSLKARLKELGARVTLQTRFSVDWFRSAGSKEGQDPWYLRVRSTSDGVSEITWKGKSEILGSSRRHHEINLPVGDHNKTIELFEVLGFEQYAHQDKDRISWSYQGWKFDLDVYPGMPAYLEIEGESEKHIQEAITLLNLGHLRASPEGERMIISKQYGLNWYDMRFK